MTSRKILASRFAQNRLGGRHVAVFDSRKRAFRQGSARGERQSDRGDHRFGRPGAIDRRRIAGTSPICKSPPCAIASRPASTASSKTSARTRTGRPTRFPPDDREGEARRRDGRNHHPRPGVDRHPGHAGRHGRLHREADVPDDRRGPRDGQGRAKVKPRHAGRHAAAFDADQQLGQRPGEERRARQDPDGDRPEFRRPRPLDQRAGPADARRRQRQLVGHLDQSGRVAALPSELCTTAGTAGGTTTAAAAASASPAGAPTPTTRSTAAWAPTTPARSRSGSKKPVKILPTGQVRQRAAIWTGRHRHGLPRHGQASSVRGRR